MPSTAAAAAKAASFTDEARGVENAGPDIDGPSPASFCRFVGQAAK